jgi:hypothetical protein
MPQRILTFLGVSLSLLVAGEASAQVFARMASRVVKPRASMSIGRVSGTVLDAAGAAVEGASVVAVGATLVADKSDRFGRFALALPPGEYVLRAAREGYVSTFREAIRVRASVRLERDITLVRQDSGVVGPRDLDSLIDPNSHTAIAWRLRHLKRSVLRNGSAVALTAESDPRVGSSGQGPGFLVTTGLEGQVNLLASGSFDGAEGWSTGRWAGQVAYVAVGAPVGSHGKWTVRAGMTSGEPSSWILVGDYQANADRAHAFSAGVSYGRQEVGSTRSSIAADRRTVGSVYASDIWTVGSALEVDYGLRLDRYDYLATPELFSPRLGVRVRTPARTGITVRLAQRMAAPGAGEFRAPVEHGLWMPPERTFSSLEVGTPLDAERVRDLEVGLDREFGQRSTARTVSIRYFRQSVKRQTATVFGSVAGNASHYFVTASGDVDVDGFVVGVAGVLLPHVRGTVDYSVSDAEWLGRGTERLHGVAAVVDAEIPRTSTSLMMAYRVSSGFGRVGQAPGLAARFAVELRQALPYQPIRGGNLEFVVGVRNLFRDVQDTRSVYDELLTLGPPMRFVGGFQIRF